jgi:uncharacterized protein (TIGR03435 family)
VRKYVLILALTTAAAAQNLAFEVATIRPAAAVNPQDVLSGRMNIGMSTTGNQVSIRYMSLRDLAVLAYEVKPFDVTGPDWLGQQRFDITALLSEGATEADLPRLLQSLLKERFKLVAHKETKESDIYALTVARGGHKMKPAPEVVEAPPEADAAKPETDPAKPSGPGMVINGQRMNINQTAAGPGGANVSITGGRNGTQRVSVGPDGQMHMEIERMTMKEVAQALSPMLDLPVEDRTGLEGAFQIALDLSMADLMQVMNKAGIAAGANALPPQAQGRLSQLAAADPGGTLQASVQKLGLRLEKQKGAIQSLVIESAEKVPTEN